MLTKSEAALGLTLASGEWLRSNALPLRPSPALTERLHIALHGHARHLLAVEELDQVELGGGRPELGIKEPGDLAGRKDGRPRTSTSGRCRPWRPGPGS